MKKEKMPDFGEKIGGARKDLWFTGISEETLKSMTEAEKAAHVNRKEVWPMGKSKDLVASGIPPFVVYYRQKVRAQTYERPSVSALARDIQDPDELITVYVREMNRLKDLVMDIKTDSDVSRFASEIDHSFFPGLIKRRSKLVDVDLLRWKCEQTNFPYGKEGKERKKRKPAFCPPQLTQIRREGIDYRGGLSVTPATWQAQFGYRGVEFGNWLSALDRQVSMNFCFDATMDLARTLNMSNKDITFGGKLALAFGARGHGHASAHYEPGKRVINLTKMHGAGCTAHEWFHALDHQISIFYGGRMGELASEQIDHHTFPEEFVRLITVMKRDEEGNKTDFLMGSEKFDKLYSKEAHGYWASNCEMAARAFACYCSDSFGRKSDYLFAHADTFISQYECQDIYAIPQYEEREIINEAFDALFYRLICDGLLHNRKPEEDRPGQLWELFDYAWEYGSQDAEYKIVKGNQGQLRYLL